MALRPHYKTSCTLFPDFIEKDVNFKYIIQILRNTGLVSSSVSLNPCGGASLDLAGHPSSDGVTMKMSYKVDILFCQPVLHPIFSYQTG